MNLQRKEVKVSVSGPGRALDSVLICIYFPQFCIPKGLGNSFCQVSKDHVVSFSPRVMCAHLFYIYMVKRGPLKNKGLLQDDLMFLRQRGADNFKMAISLTKVVYIVVYSGPQLHKEDFSNYETPYRWSGPPRNTSALTLQLLTRDELPRVTVRKCWISH